MPMYDVDLEGGIPQEYARSREDGFKPVRSITQKELEIKFEKAERKIGSRRTVRIPKKEGD